MRGLNLEVVTGFQSDGEHAMRTAKDDAADHGGEVAFGVEAEFLRPKEHRAGEAAGGGGVSGEHIPMAEKSGDGGAGGMAIEILG